jgi:alkylation response protein AidB-like acyl-CoA dehydrogenase
VDLLLTEPQTLFAESATRLCFDHGGPKRLRALRAATAEMDAETWRAIVEAGWVATTVAEARGGQDLGASGLGAFDLALALEQVGRQLLLVPLLEAAAVASILSRVADASRTEAALADLLRGARLIVPATQAQAWRYGGGAPTIVYDRRTGVLDGTIPFVAYGGSADAFLVAIDAGPQAVLALVPRGDVAVATERGVDGSTASRLTFSKTYIPAESVLATGAEARSLTSRLHELLALGAAIELTGLAAAALDVTLDYVKLRQQFGKPIGSFQVLQHRAVNGFIDVELNRSLIYRVLGAFDAGEHHPAMVSAAKARASRAALEITRAALQMHGAIGYTEEHDIGLYYKRAMALAAQYGGELGHAGAFSALTLEPAGASL